MTRSDYDHPVDEDMVAAVRGDFADIREQMHRDFMAAFERQKRTLVPCLVIAFLLIAISNVLAIIVSR